MFSAKNTAWNFQATWKCGRRGTLEQQETGWSDVSIEKDGNQHTIGIHGRSRTGREREDELTGGRAEKRRSKKRKPV